LLAAVQVDNKRADLTQAAAAVRADFVAPSMRQVAVVLYRQP
jgi:hypothetical protein